MHPSLLFLDVNSRLHLFSPSKNKSVLISQNVSDFAWHSSEHLFAFVSNSSLNICYAPHSHFLDSDLALLATLKIQLLSSHCRISAISSGLVQVLSLKSDVVNHFSLSASGLSLMKLLTSGTSEKTTNQSLKLCRFNDDPLPWTILASHSLAMGDLLTAEVALASLNLLDKVRLIQKIGNGQGSSEAKLEACLLLNKNEKAAQILRNTSNPYLAVRFHTRAFQFSEAWAKAKREVSQDSDMSWLQDYVLFKRQRFLNETCEGKEFDDFFKRLSPSGTKENVKSRKKQYISK